MQEGHSARIRPDRWREIEKHAWKLSQEAGRLIKPTDVLDAIISLKVKEIELEDVEGTKKKRTMEKKTKSK